MDRVEKVAAALMRAECEAFGCPFKGLDNHDDADVKRMMAQAAIAALDATPPETADERQAAIVAWLRGELPSAYTDPQYDIGIKLADAIESGEWRRA